MEENRDVAEIPRIACAVCQQEIPLSEAVVPEASDYVAHFCCLECYAAWRRRAANAYPTS